MTRVLALLSCLTAAAHAAPADELSALFLRACLPFAGEPAALRAWARGLKLPEVPQPARRMFLHGAPGVVFDASTPAGKLVLVSSDDGICAAITDTADDRAVATALEAALRSAGVTFRKVIERKDAENQTLHHREYLASHKARAWRILAATVLDDGPGQAMLTAAPE